MTMMRGKRKNRRDGLDSRLFGEKVSWRQVDVESHDEIFILMYFERLDV